MEGGATDVGVAQTRSARSEFLVWYVQRVSGAMLGVLVLVHLVTMIVAVRGGLDAAEILGRVGSTPLWTWFYALFVLATAAHAPIGIRNVARELGGWSTRTANAAAIAGALLIVGLGMRAVAALHLAASA